MTTERAPYVIKRQEGQGPFEREVPWRDGNSTRSAHRHELLRLLIAAVAPPDATVVKLMLRVRHQPATQAHPAMPERLELILWGTVFFGPPASPVVVLPAHLMAAEVDFAPEKPGTGPLGSIPIMVTFAQRTVPASSAMRRQEAIEPHPLGVDVRLGDVYIAGPGTLTVRGTADIPIKRRAALLDTQRVAVRLALPGSWRRTTCQRIGQPGADSGRVWRPGALGRYIAPCCSPWSHPRCTASLQSGRPVACRSLAHCRMVATARWSHPRTSTAGRDDRCPGRMVASGVAPSGSHGRPIRPRTLPYGRVRHTVDN